MHGPCPFSHGCVLLLRQRHLFCVGGCDIHCAVIEIDFRPSCLEARSEGPGGGARHSATPRLHVRVEDLCAHYPVRLAVAGIELVRLDFVEDFLRDFVSDVQDSGGGVSIENCKSTSLR
jgi:hypothetical protein